MKKGQEASDAGKTHPRDVLLTCYPVERSDVPGTQLTLEVSSVDQALS